jgi:hippurate hydrolase
VTVVNPLHQELVALRQNLHREPELGLTLPKTQSKVLAALEGLDLEITTGRELSSVTAVLRGGRPGPTVLLRGDMDALPLTEQTGLDYASEIGGTMHACGHDLHTAGLVGAAKLLAAQRESLAGTVVFMFQPGEEGYDGASVMLREGVLEASGERPIAAFGLHALSMKVPAGTVATKPGPLMSASAGLSVTVRGAGGHGSMPSAAKDPVPVLCEIVLALQTVVTREFDVFDPVVLTVSTLSAGTQRNVIPPTASFDATVRCYSDAALAKLSDVAPRTAHGIAAAHGVEVDVAFTEEYPVTVNDATETDFALSVTRDLFGDSRTFLMENPSAASEDFSRVLDEIPGCYVFFGASPPGVDPLQAANNHSPFAHFTDEYLVDGARLLAEFARRRLDAAARA